MARHTVSVRAPRLYSALWWIAYDGGWEAEVRSTKLKIPIFLVVIVGHRNGLNQWLHSEDSFTAKWSFMWSFRYIQAVPSHSSILSRTVLSTYSDGSLRVLKTHGANSFNFAWDVVDYWASKSPAMQAMHWVSQDTSHSRLLDYAHFQRQSHRISVFLETLGVRLGQVILIVLPWVPAW